MHLRGKDKEFFLKWASIGAFFLGGASRARVGGRRRARARHVMSIRHDMSVANSANTFPPQNALKTTPKTPSPQKKSKKIVE